MIYVGIDPGQKGGISFVSPDSYCSLPMPSTYNLNILLISWNEDYRIAHCFLEKAQAMTRSGRKQGVSSMFKYGDHYGQIQGLLVAHQISHTLIPPKEWQKEMFKDIEKKDAIKNPKGKALEAVKKIFPKEKFLPTIKHKNPHDGMIDSILLAEFCRRKMI